MATIDHYADIDVLLKQAGYPLRAEADILYHTVGELYIEETSLCDDEAIKNIQATIRDAIAHVLGHLDIKFEGR